MRAPPCRDAAPVRIVTGSASSGVAVSKVVVLVAVMVGATSACVAVITVYIVRERWAADLGCCLVFCVISVLRKTPKRVAGGVGPYRGPRVRYPCPLQMAACSWPVSSPPAVPLVWPLSPGGGPSRNRRLPPSRERPSPAHPCVCRFKRGQAAKKQLRGQMKNFKYLMTGLTKQLGDPAYRHIEGLRDVKELAFVITGGQPVWVGGWVGGRKQGGAW